MQLQIYAPRLDALVLESLERYANLRFSKLSRILPKLGQEFVRVSADQENYSFVIKVEIRGARPIFIQVTHPNLYNAIDEAYDVLKKTINRQKDRARRR